MLREHNPSPGNFEKIGFYILPSIKGDVSATTYWNLIKETPSSEQIKGVEFNVSRKSGEMIIIGKVVLAEENLPWEYLDGKDVILMGKISSGSIAISSLKNVRTVDSKEAGRVRVVKAEDLLWWEIV
jgi:hypothetical protein